MNTYMSFHSAEWICLVWSDILRMRAGKGKMITRLSGVLGSGVFEDLYLRETIISA